MNKDYKWIFIIGSLVLVALLAYGLMDLRDNRSPMEKVGDAIHELPQGLDKAERQLEDRTPRRKLGDAVKDAGDSINEGANRE